MANRYWVGGTGTWSDATNHWSSASGGTPNASFLPTSADNVFFDSASAAANYTVTVSSGAVCADFTCAAPASGALTVSNSTSNWTIYGSFTLYSGIVLAGGGKVNFGATSAGKTITSAGKSIVWAMEFNGSGGGWTQTDNLVTGSGGVGFTHSAGTYNTGNFNLSFYTFTSSGTRTMITGTSTLLSLIHI